MPSDLSAADIAEGHRLMQALADPRTGAEADERMAIWLFGHLPALLDAAEKAAALQAEMRAESDLQEDYDQWLKQEFGVDEGAYERFLEERRSAGE